MDLLENDFDVVVVGGGTAGAVAAVQAARAGARTAVVEMAGQLGGTMTTGGIPFPGMFDAWGKQVIAGIGWELVKETLELEGRELPDFTEMPCPHGGRHLPISAPLFACLAEEACLEAGVELFYHELLFELERAERWTVCTVGKGLRRRLACTELVDCTGDADVVALAGLDRVKSETLQPGTLVVKFGGYDADELDADDVQRRYEAAIAEGTLVPGDFAYAGRSRFIHFLRRGGTNSEHVVGIDGSTSTGKTRANIEGRKSIIRLLRFVRSVPGCEKANIVSMRGETAIRETYRIVGETEITREDYLAGRVYEDAVCHAFYHIDIHLTTGTVNESVPEGVVPTVPLSALVPKGSRNLLAAGRCVSSDREANSALRAEVPCMAMGQAAGAAAALGVKKGTPSRDVPLGELKTLLKQHGAIVP